VTRRQALRRSAYGIAVVVAGAGLHAGCAERIGNRAAAGAVAALQKQHDEHPDQRPAKIAAASAVEGAVEALDTPEQRARIERMVAQAVESAIEALDTPEQRARIQRMVSDAAGAATETAVERVTRQLVAALGAEGEGPLTATLSKSSERIATSSVGSVGAQLAALMPECTGPDKLDCIERRLQRTARATAVSFTSGVEQSIGWEVCAAAFVLGAGGGVLGAWLWSLRNVRRRSLRMA
jgi:hypothetical protein